jgi:hypothetical protein
MRYVATLLGFLGVAAGTWVALRFLQVAQSIQAMGEKWDAGRAISSEAGMRALYTTLVTLWSGAGLLALSCLLGLIGTLLALAKPRAGRILMIIGAFFLLAGAAAAAVFIFRSYPPPEGMRAARAVGAMIAAPGAAFLLAGFFVRRKKAATPPPMTPRHPAGLPRMPASALGVCTSCGTPADEPGVNFCGACGARLIAPR